MLISKPFELLINVEFHDFHAIIFVVVYSNFPERPKVTISKRFIG